MTQLRCTLVALLGLTLAACEDDPTVVAVNITYGAGITTTTETVVQVMIEQNGETLSDEFETPLRAVEQANPDGGPMQVIVDVPDTAYFKRYTLDSFAGGDALVTVKLLENNRVVYTEATEFDIRENGATAVYVEFEIEPPTDTTSGETSSTTAPVDAGTDSGPADTSGEGSSAPTDAGDNTSATVDAGPDAGSDTGMDAGSDAGSADASVADAG